jgi:hypothetical protein
MDQIILLFAFSTSKLFFRTRHQYNIMENLIFFENKKIEKCI